MNLHEEYETAVTFAHDHFAKVMDAAYTDVRDAVQKAWYDYQVKAGIIPAPPASSTESEKTDDSSQGGSGSEPGAGDPGHVAAGGPVAGDHGEEVVKPAPDGNVTPAS